MRAENKVHLNFWVEDTGVMFLQQHSGYGFDNKTELAQYIWALGVEAFFKKKEYTIPKTPKGASEQLRAVAAKHAAQWSAELTAKKKTKT